MRMFKIIGLSACAFGWAFVYFLLPFVEFSILALFVITLAIITGFIGAVALTGAISALK